MIHYHGGPITPDVAAIEAWKGGHALISFAHPDQLGLAADISQSFCLDNGAFSFWRAGKRTDWDGYYRWVAEFKAHPAFDWALIPDVIAGSEIENDDLVTQWPYSKFIGVPVWHLHESLQRLERLVNEWPRVAFGSSGQWHTPGTKEWWARITEAMAVVCDEQGSPKVKLHGLRMLAPAVFTSLPFASADSTNIARNIGIEKHWTGSYKPPTKRAKAALLRLRIEEWQSPATWNPKAIAANRSLVRGLSRGLVGTEAVLDTGGAQPEGA